MTARIEQPSTTKYIELTSKNGSTQISSSNSYIPLVDKEKITKKNEGLVLEKNNDAIKTENNPDNIYKLFTRLNLNLSKEDSIRFLANSNNVTEKEILASNYKTIQGYLNHIEGTIKVMKEDGIEITPENIQYQAKKYNLVVKNGWDSIESFRIANKKNNESITKRLERFAGKPIVAMTTEEKANLIREYFLDNFNTKATIKKGLNTFKNWIGLSDKSSEEFEKELKIHKQTDFIKLLHNSSEEEFELLKDAIEYLDAENRLSSAGDILKSFKEMNDAINFAETHYDYEFISKNSTKSDTYDNRPTDNSTKLIEDIAELRSYHGVEATEKYEQEETRAARRFYQNNSDKIDAIKQKINQGIHLTEEEQETYSQRTFFTSSRVSGTISILNNKNNFDNETKIKLLSQTNNNTILIAEVAGEDFYRETLYTVSKYIKNNSKKLSVTVEEAKKLINIATNGDYSIVIQDKINKTRTPLKGINTNKNYNKSNKKDEKLIPEKGLKQNNSDNTNKVKTRNLKNKTTLTNQTNQTNHTNPIKNNYSRQTISTNKNTIIYKQEETTKTVSKVIEKFKKAVASGNYELIIESKKSLPDKIFVTEIIANKNNLKDTRIIEEALKTFEDMTAYEKENTLKISSIEVFKELISHMTNRDFLAIGLETFSNTSETKIFKENLEVAKEETCMRS